MKTLFGITLALALVVPLTVAAEETRGKVQAVDTADRSIVLQDGTRLSVEDRWLGDVQPGDQVRASFESKDGRKLVTTMDRLNGVRWNDTPGVKAPTAHVEGQ